MYFLTRQCDYKSTRKRIQEKEEDVCETTNQAIQEEMKKEIQREKKSKETREEKQGPKEQTDSMS